MGSMGESGMSYAYDEFLNDLNYSIDKESKMDSIYKSYFKSVKHIKRYDMDDVDDIKKQYAGIDTQIILESGERIRVQDKWSRYPFKGLYLIEYLHIYIHGREPKHGWIYTTDADYIFSVYGESNIVKIYPVVQLKIAWSYNMNEWLNKYLKIEVPNPKPPNPTQYITHCVLVPCDVVEEEITKVQTFNYQRPLIP
jgi:hypothetical protein